MEPESPSDPVTDDASEASKASCAQDTEPRLGIIHLIGWIAFTAIYMGVQQSLDGWVASAAPDFSPSVGYSVLQLAWGLDAGMAIGTVFLMLVRRRRGITFPAHPGEFLAVLHGLIILAGVAGLVVLYALTFETDWIPLGMSYLQVFLFALPQFVIWAFFTVWAWRSIQQVSWRLFIVGLVLSPILLFALQDFLPSMMWIPAWQATCVKLGMPLLLLFAVLTDKRVGKRRPWTHWIGIGLQFWLWFTEWILPSLVPI